MILRPYQTSDRDTVVELNLASESVLSPMDGERLDWLLLLSDFAVVCELEDQVVGFMLVFAEDSDYDGEAYQWFDQRYDNFFYVDRIIVDESARGRGLAKMFYQQLLETARSNQKACLLAEIDIEPPNEPSLKFHRAFGFIEVGTITYAKGKQVSQQCLNLET